MSENPKVKDILYELNELREAVDMLYMGFESDKNLAGMGSLKLIESRLDQIITYYKEFGEDGEEVVLDND